MALWGGQLGQCSCWHRNRPAAALERGHHALGVYVGKTLELKCRLEARASQVNSVKSADTWFDEAEGSFDEIIALLDTVTFDRENAEATGH